MEHVLKHYATFKQTRLLEHVGFLRKTNPKLADWTNDEIMNLYDNAVTCFQSKAGAFLEKYVEDKLRDAGVAFRAQVGLDEKGYIVEGRGTHIPDIVFGDPRPGTHISNYVVMSLKTSSRERSKLDTAWTYKNPPKLFLYATLEDDYPQPEKFGESENRKLVCASTKKRDNRTFKLGFEDIIPEIQRAGCSVQSSL